MIMAIDFYENIKKRKEEFVKTLTSLISKDRELQLYMKSVTVS